MTRQIDTARRQRHWDLRAAGNFIGGGSGGGLLIASALAAATGRPAMLPVAAGVVLVALGLALVWLELGKPWRALNVFFHPQTSWMTREGILAGPLLASGALAAVTLQGFWFGLAAALAAGYVYCQARILRASRAIPAWSHPRIVPLIACCALAEGFGAFVALAGGASTTLVGGALVTTLLVVGAHEAYHRGLVAARAPEGTLACFASPLMRALQALRVGAVLLYALALAGLPVAALAGAIAVLTGWAFKAILVTRAGYTRGARILHTPARGRGTAGSVL
jgi:phenylacetyl-CoA:acceptor oxidoreductase 26-kDa subunit